MSKVVFVKGDRQGFEKGEDMGKVFMALRQFGMDDFKGKKVLVKLHMGEAGNKYYLKPPLIKQFVDELKSTGAEPFLFDTAVMYPGSRHTKEEYTRTAEKHGFGELGCPLIIGNEGNSIEVEVNGQDYGFEVAKELCDVECVLSIAHGKGHGMTGFGGSIKAFGMGGVSRESKTFIHKAGAPVMENGEECTLCSACMEVCPKSAIKVGDEWIIDYSKCNGCERCVRNCPQGVLKWREEEFDLMLSAAAKACVSKFGSNNKPKKTIYVNVVTDISKYCDCASDAGPIIAPDVGIFVSDDPVAIDAASIDMIEEVGGKSLEEIQNTDPRMHVRYGEELGMGKMDYEMEKMEH